MFDSTVQRTNCMLLNCNVYINIRMYISKIFSVTKHIQFGDLLNDNLLSNNLTLYSVWSKSFNCKKNLHKNFKMLNVIFVFLMLHFCIQPLPYLFASCYGNGLGHRDAEASDVRLVVFFH